MYVIYCIPAPIYVIVLLAVDCDCSNVCVSLTVSKSGFLVHIICSLGVPCNLCHSTVARGAWCTYYVKS
jgi:hypothetical protein